MTNVQEAAVYSLFVQQNIDIDPLIDLSKFLEFISTLQADDIFDIISAHSSEICEITTGNIPQFSEERDMYKALRVIIDSESTDMDYNELGYYLCCLDRKAEAKRKYAENQYKLASQLGFAYDRKPLQITPLGSAFCNLPDDHMRAEVLKRLCLKIPVMQHILLQATTTQVDVVTFLGHYLAHSTVLRRRSNIHTFLDWLRTISRSGMLQILNRISW